MDGEGLDTTHNGVRGDVIDRYPGLFGITVAGKAGVSQATLTCPFQSREIRHQS